MRNNMGNIKLAGVLEGVSEIKNNTGNVILLLDQAASGLSWEVSSNIGDVRVNGDRHYVKNTAAVDRLRVTTDIGDVTLDFTK